MKIPRVKSCCCGIRLKTAGLIFAVLSALAVVVELYSTLSELSDPEASCLEYAKKNPDLVKMLDFNCGERSVAILKLLSYAMLVNYLTAAPFVAILLIGVIKENYLLLKIFVIVDAVEAVSLTALLLIGGIVGAILYSPVVLIFALIMMIIICPLAFYILIVLYSLQCEFKEKENNASASYMFRKFEPDVCL